MGPSRLAPCLRDSGRRAPEWALVGPIESEARATMNTGTQWYVGAGVAALLIAAGCTPDNTTTNPTPPPRFSNCIDKPQTCGGGGIPGFRMTGGGRIDPAVGKTTFGF